MRGNYLETRFSDRKRLHNYSSATAKRLRGRCGTATMEGIPWERNSPMSVRGAMLLLILPAGLAAMIAAHSNSPASHRKRK